MAPGLTPISVIDKFSTIQMVDVYLPTTDGRSLILPRYTMPNEDIQIILKQMKIELPAQPPPKIYFKNAMKN